MPNKEWAICDRNGEPITLRLINADTKESEDMIQYANLEAVQNAYSLLLQSDIEEHGLHIKEIPLS